MTQNKHKRKPGAQRLNRLEESSAPSGFDAMKVLAYSLIFGIWAVAATIPQNNYGALWIRPTTVSETALFVTRLLVFGEIVVMVFRWINATHNELRLWVVWLPKQPCEKQEAYGAMFGLSVLLGLELALVPHVRLLTFAAATLALFNCWTQWVANEHFVEALEFSRSDEENPIKHKIFNLFEHYWVRKPQITRIATQIYFIGLAFTIAVVAVFEPGPEKAWYQAIAYAILFLTILVTEIMITIWRHERDEELEKLEAKLLQKLEHA